MYINCTCEDSEDSVNVGFVCGPGNSFLRSKKGLLPLASY